MQIEKDKMKIEEDEMKIEKDEMKIEKLIEKQEPIQEIQNEMQEIKEIEQIKNQGLDQEFQTNEDHEGNEIGDEEQKNQPQFQIHIFYTFIIPYISSDTTTKICGKFVTNPSE